VKKPKRCQRRYSTSALVMRTLSQESTVLRKRPAPYEKDWTKCCTLCRAGGKSHG
jgi:hypothetical protein